MRRLIAIPGLAVLAATLVFTAPVLAQGETSDGESFFDDVSWYAHGMLTLPFGDFGDAAGTGFGGGLGGRKPYNEQVSFRAEIGYIMFGSKDIGDVEFSYNMIPILALAEYQADPDNPLYFLGGLGFYRLAFDADYTGPATGFGFVDDYDGSSTEIGIAGGAGYRANEQVGIEGRLHLVSDANILSVHGTYSF